MILQFKKTKKNSAYLIKSLLRLFAEEASILMKGHAIDQDKVKSLQLHPLYTLTLVGRLKYSKSFKGERKHCNSYNSTFL